MARKINKPEPEPISNVDPTSLPHVIFGADALD